MATVNKDFRVKAGLIVEGANATVNGEDILTTGSTTSDLTEGTNLYFTNQRALDATSAAYDPAGSAATAQAAAEDYADGLASNYEAAGSIATAINALDTDDIEEGVTNLYFTSSRALSATASAYDSAGSAASAITTANGYTDTAIGALDTDDIEEGVTNLYFTNQRALDATSAAYDAAGAAATAENNAKSYADGLASNYDAAGAAATAESNANGYTDTAVSNLVSGAPELLDTLNELAAAIGDDANFASTITTSIGTKVSKSGDTMTGALTLSGAPTSDLHAATKKYVDDAIGGVTNLTEVVLPDVLLGSETATAGTSGSTVDTWSTATYSTAKYLVQMKSGSDIHVLEVLVTVDGGNNVYVTEYAEVISNASLGTTDAAYSTGSVNFTVTATNAGTAVKLSKTYIEA
jgi:hypothetical protein